MSAGNILAYCKRCMQYLSIWMVALLAATISASVIPFATGPTLVLNEGNENVEPLFKLASNDASFMNNYPDKPKDTRSNRIWKRNSPTPPQPDDDDPPFPKVSDFQ
ncbi:hypothetical protein BATDEDRAFT_24397 [Batrachochytrium dendrobatidis JAM81]|uniref:Uncharacterized protein n=1 Tax=Batrachochytrium dendrobatidis (strain JAM81 / FGSC 10211) TaxID=684364 RepID=F4P1A7_BATDJ|nr:uncharacterized protein BATDEDRAFT_24397 [Batrachochytrium dendrobatidis JAM81]EGF80627.1 hypothetical protein BATDEDRAFT_24397 [Batrachochytrium dendrobatidis JAM81]|eukprot:XP_006678442.1 hypothetical protein BATDEDRAFT_24397 [Batrachochytrium dendrobatidis JAM81]